MKEKSRAWIELNREHLEKNVEYLKQLLPDECSLMPAVKANAYGHGAILIAKALQDIGIQHFCVASLREGIELREGGIKGEILILGYTPPELMETLAAYGLTQTIVDEGYAQLISQTGGQIPVHIGVDTGMHRLGIPWDNPEEIRKVWEKKHLAVTGIFSHLCVSDGDSREDRAYTKKQISRFDKVLEELHAHGKEGFAAHLQGSYGILNYPDCRYDYARPGIAMYGVLSKKEDQAAARGLRPVLELKTRVECVKRLKAGERLGYGLVFQAGRDSQAAVLSIGYADGIPRNFAQKGRVLLGGEKVPVAGRICMDQMFVDITDRKSGIPIEAGAEAVLIGCQGEAQITAEEFADSCGTITNEVLSRMGERLERFFLP